MANQIALFKTQQPPLTTAAAASLWDEMFGGIALALGVFLVAAVRWTLLGCAKLCASRQVKKSNF
jgi:hypothetical protein